MPLLFDIFYETAFFSSLPLHSSQTQSNNLKNRIHINLCNPRNVFFRVFFDIVKSTSKTRRKILVVIKKLGKQQKVLIMSRFQDEHTFEKRQAEAQRIRQKYPDRIPVICERANKTSIPNIDKKKYLVPADLTVGQFVYVIRKRIELPPEKAIFIFVNNQMPPTASMMSTIYEEQKSKDGFLYITYSGENTFGSSSQ